MKAIRLTVLAFIVLSLIGILPVQSPETYAAGKCTVRVAQQYGLWCAVNTIVVQKKLIEKYAPIVRLWKLDSHPAQTSEVL